MKNTPTKNTLTQFKMDSPTGSLFLVASAHGLQTVSWQKQNIPVTKDISAATKENKIIKNAVKQLEEYFSGKRKEFDLEFDIAGTEFQRKVWRELTQIPYGKTQSYKQVAAKLKSKAFRAVGSANGKNPLCIVVPCHRVVAADGTLGGFSGGLNNKKILLALENAPNFN